jgi:NAD/NADP transhydrogenase beta subunit
MRMIEPNDSLRRVRAIAVLLDDALRVPGTNIRFGIDPLIGMIPGLGDLLGGAASAYIILEAARAGAPASLLLRMTLNVGLDTLVGALPVVGDLFDFAWKSNARNVRLFSQHVEAPAQTRRASIALVVLLLAILAGIAIGAAILAVYVIRRLIG